MSYEDEKNKKYIEALEAEDAILRQGVPAIPESGEAYPTVEVKEEPKKELIKPSYQQALIQDMAEAAKRQTEADARDFAANRAAGDREMLGWAMENGRDLHFGGPNNWQRPINRGSGNMWRKGIEDNALPSGEYLPVPNHLDRVQRPENIQRQMDRDAHEMRTLELMEAIEELKKRQAYNT